MKRLLTVLFILSTLALCGGAWGTDYYADTTLGNDSNNGLSGTDEGGGVGPWQTTTRVNTAVTGTLGSNLVTDGGLEAVTGDDWTNWHEALDGASNTIESEESIVHGGSTSVKFIGGGEPYPPFLRSLDAITVSESTDYMFSFWVYGDGTHQAFGSIYDLSHTAWLLTNISGSGDLDTYEYSVGWVQVHIPFTTPAGCTNIFVYMKGNGAAGAVVYVDDITLYQRDGNFLAPGDSVLFKCAEDFSHTGAGTATLIPVLSGTAENPITYGSYGTGAKPIIGGQYDPTPLYRERVVRMRAGVSHIKFENLDIQKGKNALIGCLLQNDDVAVDTCSLSDSGRGVAPDALKGWGIIYSENVNACGNGLAVIDTTITNTYDDGIVVQAANTVDMITSLTISGCTITNSYNVGIAIWGNYEGAGDYSINGFSLINNHIEDNRCGIYLYQAHNGVVSANTLIDNNDQTIPNTDSYCIALEECSDIQVLRNWGENAYSHGIELWAAGDNPGYNVTVAYNYMANQTRGDPGENAGTGIKFSGAHIDNVKCYGNLLVGNVHGINIHGEGAEDGHTSLCANNTMYGNAWGMAILSGSGGWDLVNNIMSGNTLYQLGTEGGDSSPTFTHTHNLYYDTGSDNEIEWGATTYTIAQVATFEATAKNADPLFVNPASGDFTLQPGSPCIGAAVDLGDTYKIDYAGYDKDLYAPWEIGAYEYTHGLKNILHNILRSFR